MKKKTQKHRVGRWVLIIIVSVIITVGSTLWIWSAQGSWVAIPPIVFTVLGVILAFIQILPSIFSNSSSASKSMPSSHAANQAHEPLLAAVPVSPPPTQVVSTQQHPVQLHPDNVQEDWDEAPRFSILYGRQKELNLLEQYINTDKCKIVAVIGIGGIGKTALVSTLVDQVKPSFGFLFWRSLQNAPPIKELLDDCIQFFAKETQTSLTNTLDQQILLLLTCLRQNRCLIVLDNFETLLQTNDSSGRYRDGYEGYGKLLTRIGESQHQSCLLLTSREKPKEIIPLQGTSSPVRTLQLLGLDQSEGTQLLLEKGVVGSNEDVNRLFFLYSGNPLALKLISETIQEVFQGNPAKFLKEGTIVFGDIFNLIEQQFSRLSQLEQSILYWLAVEREWVSTQQLRQNLIQVVSQGHLISDLNSLRRKSLIQTNDAGFFSLQPVIMEYVEAQLNRCICREISEEKLDVFENQALIMAQTKDYIREAQIRMNLSVGLMNI